MLHGERAPQWLIIEKPISPYISYAAMICPLHSNINIEQCEKNFCNPSAITENMKDSLVKRVPHILMHESHNVSISAMSNSFHNITAVRSVSVIFVSCTEAITR